MGRSATIISASQSLEPIFSFHHPMDGIHPLLQAYLIEHSLHEDTKIIDEIKKTGNSPQIMRNHSHPFITATELQPNDHIEMIITAQRAIDESISKTVNLPEDTPEQIASIYSRAYAAGLKGISVFRNNSRSSQPKQLAVVNNDDKK